MNTHRKTICFKLFGLQLPVLLLLGSTGVIPLDSHAEKEGGSINAKGSVAAAARDPFWPVGYESKQAKNAKGIKVPQKAKGSIDWNRAMKQVVINGVSSRAEGEYVAVINNEVKSVGESVSIQYGGTRYTWKVDSITPPGSVKLLRLLAE